MRPSPSASSWWNALTAHLGLGGAHGACQGQPGMSMVVLGHLGPGTCGAIHHARDNLKCPQLSWDGWYILDLGGTHTAYQGQPGMSTVVLRQTGHLGPGTYWCRTPCQGQPEMSTVVLEQMGHCNPSSLVTVWKNPWYVLQCSSLYTKTPGPIK